MYPSFTRLSGRYLRDYLFHQDRIAKEMCANQAISIVHQLGLTFSMPLLKQVGLLVFSSIFLCLLDPFWLSFLMHLPHVLCGVSKILFLSMQ